jgi:hypothetical protein
VAANAPQSPARWPLIAAIGTLAVFGSAITGLAIAATPSSSSALAREPQRDQVTLGFDKAERGRRVSVGVPVSRAGHAHDSEPRVVYSVRLPGLRRSQKLRIRGIAAITRCDQSDQRLGGGAHEGTLHSPCESIRHPYSVPGGGQYDPRVAARAFIGFGPSDLRDPVGHWDVQPCTTALHHCPLEVSAKVDHPPRAHDMWLNLAVASFSPDARVGSRGQSVDVVELDGDCKHHDFNPASGYCKPVLTSASSNTQGELTAIRFGSSRKPTRPRTTRKLINRQIRVQGSRRSSSATRPRIVLRQRLRHLSPGDVVDAKASFHLRDDPGDGYVFRHEVSGLMFLSADPTAIHPRTSSGSRWLAASARTNCPHSSGCEIEKVGAATVPEEAPKTMWVTYVGSARDSGGLNGAPTDITGGTLRAAVDKAADR